MKKERAIAFKEKECIFWHKGKEGFAGKGEKEGSELRKSRRRGLKVKYNIL
jgi:hypothetical protein